MTSIAMSPAKREADAAEPVPATAPATVHGAGHTDERAFRQMVLDHGAHVQRLLRSLGVNEADLDDICQESFLVAFRKLATFEGRSTLRTWLCGIALRVASDYRDKAYRRRELPSLTLPLPPMAAQQENAVASKQAWQLLEGMLARLRPEQREVFVLYEVAELSVPEAAKLLGCPLQTAYSRLNAARERVQQLMAELRAQEKTP